MKLRVMERSGRPRVARAGGPAGHLVQAESRATQGTEEEELDMLHVALVFDDKTKTYTVDSYPIMAFDYSPDRKTLDPISMLTHLGYSQQDRIYNRIYKLIEASIVIVMHIQYKCLHP